MSRPLHRHAALALALALLAVACGDDDDDSGTAGVAGAAGIAGISGNSGQSGASQGGAGQAGAGTSGAAGASGTAGAAGAAGAAGEGGASAGTAGASGQAGSGAGAGSAGQGGSSGSSGQSGSGGASAKVTSMYDVLVPRSGGGTWPHKVDIHGSSDAIRGAVLMHGGGGHKEDFARGIGMVDDAGKVDEAWLIASRMVVAMPQGQIVPPDGVPSWTNGVMLSGQDDQAFLTDLAAALRAGTLAGQPPVGRLYVAGHSNGGMMSNWMWCRAPEVFDAYGSLAGPAARRLDAKLGSAPCAPAVARPYLGIVGSADDVLQTDGNWEKPFWSITPALTKKTISWDDPDLVNEERFHTMTRVPAVCGAASAAPAEVGKTTRWSDCDGKVRLIRVNGANHPMTSLSALSGLTLRDELLAFFVASEP
jgi:polyhydroxybutyrate depolymerase